MLKKNPDSFYHQQQWTCNSSARWALNDHRATPGFKSFCRDNVLYVRLNQQNADAHVK